MYPQRFRSHHDTLRTIRDRFLVEGDPVAYVRISCLGPL